MYRYPGYVIPARPSPWSYLLSGLGQAIPGTIQRLIQERERKKNLVGQILESAALGQLDPAFFATEPAQQFLRLQGIDKRPEIRSLVSQALEQFEAPSKIGTLPKGGAFVVPEAKPSAVPLDVYQQRQREKTAALRRQRFYTEELPEAVTKEAALTRARKQIEQEFEETPEEVIMHVAGLVEGARKRGIPLESLSYKGVNVLTAWERAKYATTQNDKVLAGQGKYYKGAADTQEYKTRAVDLLTRLKAGNISNDEANQEFRDLNNTDPLVAWLNGKWNQTNKRDPEDLKKLLFEYNRTIKAKNTENRLYAREGRMKPEDIEEIQPISEDILGDTQPPEQTANPQGQLMTTTRREEEKEQPIIREPTASEVEVEAAKLLGANYIDPETGRLMTMSKARQLAREYLKKRGTRR